jgi:hypothetical protein
MQAEAMQAEGEKAGIVNDDAMLGLFARCSFIPTTLFEYQISTT